MHKSLPENPENLGDFRPLGRGISATDEGLRVDVYLARNFRFLSRAAWQKRLDEGLVRLDGRAIGAAQRIREGQLLDLFYPPAVEPEVDRGIYPIWRKGAVMAVFKPAPLPMHENGLYRKNTFATLLQEELGPEWAAVHRLDRETSGIVLCAATYEARRALAISLASRTLEKEYLAIAHGQCQERFWIASGPIGDLAASEIRIKKWVVPEGLPSETHFHVLDQKADHVLLKAHPKTGRTNQIRIHAAHAGHHLVGDRLFYPDEQVFLEWYVQGLTDEVVRRTGHRRCLLHAHALSFVHPEDQKTYEVRCPLPEDMEQFWSQLSRGTSAAL